MTVSLPAAIAAGDDRYSADWCLIAAGGNSKALPLTRFPFTIGRHDDNLLHLPQPEVSRYHAQIVEHNGRLWLRECGSTNGTFINRQRVLQTSLLSADDSVQFGTACFKLQLRPGAHAHYASDMTQIYPLSSDMDRFQEMLRKRSVVPFFQPMQRLADGALAGYEILGRCNFDGLPRRPLQVLRRAGSTDQQVELSELFREVGLRQATKLGNRDTLFLNAAPTEIEPQRLAESLATLRHYAPELPLVLELNENAVTRRSMLKNLRARLNELDVGLAFDDFGVGRSRLLELIEYTPDWLKFDLLLIQSLRGQAGKTRRVLQSLLTMARDLGIKTVAEGIENEDDLAACQELGFDVGQGYHIGRPLPFLAQL